MEKPGITREALEKYLNRRKGELQEMRRFLNEKRFDDIVMLSHKIKGSAPTFGLDGVGRLAEKLEEQAEKFAQKEVSDVLCEMETEVSSALKNLN